MAIGKFKIHSSPHSRHQELDKRTGVGGWPWEQPVRLVGERHNTDNYCCCCCFLTCHLSCTARQPHRHPPTAPLLLSCPVLACFRTTRVAAGHGMAAHMCGMWSTDVGQTRGSRERACHAGWGAWISNFREGLLVLVGFGGIGGCGCGCGMCMWM